MKSTTHNGHVSVNRVHSVITDFNSTKKENRTLVVKNLDGLSTAPEKDFSVRLNKGRERSPTTSSTIHISRAQSSNAPHATLPLQVKAKRFEHLLCTVLSYDSMYRIIEVTVPLPHTLNNHASYRILHNVFRNH